MVPSQTFLSFLFITLSAVGASPLIHRNGGNGVLRFTTKLRSYAAGGHTLVEKDRTRARAMMEESHLSKRSDGSVTITDSFVYYVAQIGVGAPPRYYDVVIDTGSSNTWVGANNTRPYVQTQTSVNTGNSFNVTYESGSVAGEEWLDTVTVTPGLVIKNQFIGVVTSGNRTVLPTGGDGILGLGPVDLTLHIVNNTALVPTVMDNLYSQRSISEEVLGMYFAPSKDGELTFGGYDSSVITSPVEYVPRTTTYPVSRYWGITQTVLYGDQAILSNATGFVDSGTTLVLLATDAFQKYLKMTGAVLDNATGLLAISAAQYHNLKPLSFKIGGMCFDLTPDAQIWPRSLNQAVGGNASAIYLVIQESQLSSPFEFINGYSFLGVPLLSKRFYSVYDTTNDRLGFARTAYTDSMVNYSQ